MKKIEAMSFKKDFKLKSPSELSDMIKKSGLKTLEAEEIVNYIDKPHKQLLNYQMFLEFVSYTAESKNANVRL